MLLNLHRVESVAAFHNFEALSPSNNSSRKMRTCLSMSCICLQSGNIVKGWKESSNEGMVMVFSSTMVQSM